MKDGNEDDRSDKTPSSVRNSDEETGLCTSQLAECAVHDENILQSGSYQTDPWI